MWLLIRKAHYYKVLFLLVLLVASCSKDKAKYHTLVEGIVLDYETNEPITNVKVTLRDGDIYFDIGFYTNNGTYSDLKDTTYTDKNGRFRVELKKHITRARLGIVKDGYTGYYPIDDFSPEVGFIEPGIYESFVAKLKKRENEND
jgi:hypothetical protein